MYDLPGAIMEVASLIHCNSDEQKKLKPRVLISSDIGGTDPDDYQSMIQLLMYADLFQIKGLVASPYGKGLNEPTNYH